MSINPLTYATPGIPHLPIIGDRVDDKFIAASGLLGSDVGKFVVIDPIAETIDAFQITPPSGGSLERGAFGTPDASSLWCCWRSNSNNSVPMVVGRLWLDGTTDAWSSGFVFGSIPVTPAPVLVGSMLWCMGVSGSHAPRLWDTATKAPVASSFAAFTGMGQPFYDPTTDKVYQWTSDGTLYQFDGTTGTRTTVHTGGVYPNDYSQAAASASGRIVRWTTNAGTAVLELDLDAVTVNSVAVGTTFERSLAIDPDGQWSSVKGNGTIVGWDPVRGVPWSEPIAHTGAVATRMAWVAGRRVGVVR